MAGTAPLPCVLTVRPDPDGDKVPRETYWVLTDPVGLPVPLQGNCAGAFRVGSRSTYARDTYGDAIAPGKFQKSLASWKASGRSVPMLHSHDAAVPLGVWDMMQEDRKGLYAEGRLVLADPKAAVAFEHLKAGSLTGISIGFVAPPTAVEHDREGRTLKEITLFEASLVAVPANDGARVAEVRAACLSNPKNLESQLRELGLSAKQAEGLLAHGWEGLAEEDDDQELTAALDQLLAPFR